MFYRGSLLTGGRPRARHGRVRTSRRPYGHPGARRPIIATYRRPSPSLRPRASGPGTSTAVVAPNMARCTCAGSRAHAGPACPESATASTRRAASRRRPTTRRAGRSPRGGGSRCPSLRHCADHDDEVTRWDDSVGRHARRCRAGRGARARRKARLKTGGGRRAT